MQYQALHCPICQKLFDSNKHLPRIIQRCGHTICTQCLDDILKNNPTAKCPVDNLTFSSKKNVNEFTVNLVVQKFLEEIFSSDICMQHQERQRLLCFTDKVQVCDDCVLFGEHKGHDIKPLKLIQPEIDKKRKQLEIALDAIDKHYQGVTTLLKETHRSLSQKVKDKFEELIDLLTSKEGEILGQVNSFFEKQKGLVDNGLGPRSLARSNLELQISEYMNFFRTCNPFDLLEQDISLIISKFDPKFLVKEEEELINKLRTVVGSFEEILTAQMHSVAQIQAPIEKLVEISINTFEPSCSNGNTILEFGRYQDSLKISTQAKNTKVLTDVENPKEIKKVSAVIDKYVFTDEDINALFSVWRNVENVSSLELICNPQGISDHALLRLFPAIFRKTKELDTVKIFLNNCKIGDESIVFLMEKVFPKLSNLRNLELNLACTNVSDQSILAFVRYNSGIMKFLESFRLSLRDTKVTDQSVPQIFTVYTKMKTFCLDLTNTKISDKTIEAFHKNSLPSMKSLESMSLSLASTSVSDLSMIPLFMFLENIKEIILDLSNTKITDNTVIAFNKNGLKYLNHLINIELHLDNTSVTDNGVSYLGIEMEKVKRFSLYLDAADICDKTLETITKKALLSMKSLEVFEIYLSETKVTDESVMKLVKSLPSLKEFTIDLSNTRITDKMMSVLKEKLTSDLKDLENFELVLFDTAITDKGVASICVPMAKVKKYVLHLDSTEVTNKSLEAFAKNTLGSMNDLENFEIHLFDTTITDKGVMDLINHLKNPKKIIIDLDSTDVTDKFAKKFIKEVFPRLKDLKNFEIDLSNTQVSDETLTEIEKLREILSKKNQSIV